MVQLSHPYVTTGKTIALTKQTFIGRIMSLLLNMLSKWIIAFLPRNNHILISWLQSPSASRCSINIFKIKIEKLNLKVLNKLVLNQERSTSRLPTVTLLV